MQENKAYLIKPMKVMSATNAMVFYSHLLVNSKSRIEQIGGIWEDFFENNQDYLLISIPEFLYPTIIKELKYLDSTKDVTQEIKSGNIKTKVLNNFDLVKFRIHVAEAPIIYS